MSVIKNQEVCRLLKKWIGKSEFSQAQIAKIINEHPSLLSRQLACKENIDVEKITKISDLLKPPNEDIHRINAIIVSEHEEKTPDIKKHYLDMIVTTVQQIGPDGLLAQILFNWVNFSKGQKRALYEQAEIISETPNNYADKNNHSEEK